MYQLDDLILVLGLTWYNLYGSHCPSLGTKLYDPAITGSVGVVNVDSVIVAGAGISDDDCSMTVSSAVSSAAILDDLTSLKKPSSIPHKSLKKEIKMLSTN